MEDQKLGTGIFFVEMQQFGNNVDIEFWRKYGCKKEFQNKYLKIVNNVSHLTPMQRGVASNLEKLA